MKPMKIMQKVVLKVFKGKLWEYLFKTLLNEDLFSEI
jgi:hypothetical protein